MKATIHVGNCIEVLPGSFPENSVDAVVCDPPYEISFMNKGFDKTGVAHDITTWKECLRVLKPGGYCLAFGGTRTYHRLACAIEDAGFECRDVVSWCFGSGFPKSLSVSKAIDKAARGVPQGGSDPTSSNHGNYKSGCSEENPSGRGFGAGPGKFMKDSRSKYDGANRKPAPSTSEGFGYESKGGLVESQPLTDAAKQWSGWGTALKPAMELVCVARKPLSEKTVAANCLKWRTGALNIDGCRIGTEERTYSGSGSHQIKLDNHEKGDTGVGYMDGSGKDMDFTATGRWPANVIFECTCETTEIVDVDASGSLSGEEPSEVTQDIFGKFKARKPFTAYPGKAVRHTNPECPCFMLDAQSGDNTSGAMKRQVPAYDGESVTPLLRGISGPSNQHGDSGGASRFFQTVRGEEPSAERTYEESGSTNFAMKPGARRSDEGSASRFFYTAKADRTERNAGLENPGPQFEHGATLRKIENTLTRGNTHPTVKPVDLMAYLCRLVCPPHGTVLDPFMGSGSTGIAALREGFEFIGIEISPEYAAIAERRIKHDNPLFTEVEMKG